MENTNWVENLNKFTIKLSDAVPMGKNEADDQPLVNEKRAAKLKYYSEVWEETNKNAHLLDRIELRAWKGFHIDHIIPISYGFKYNLDPKMIGGVDNLQMLPYKDNLKKSTRISKQTKLIW